MRVYIAGPIKGKPDLNRKNFERCRSALLFLDHEPVVPHDIHADLKRKLRRDPTTSEILLKDLEELAKCDQAVFLDGWRSSGGARTEFEFALRVGKIVQYASVLDPSL